MTDTVLLPSRSRSPAVAGALAAWLALVVGLGAAGEFVTPTGTAPYPIAIGALVPVIAFLALFRMAGSFRELVLAADLRLLTNLQAWRVGGFGFLALYAYGVLPGMFAWPAGLGDIAIGVTAPWIAAALIHRRGFAAGTLFRTWNLLGILDLVVALGTGALGAVLAAGVAGEVTTRPMAQLPLLLIPAYFVPIFVMLHLAALFQARRVTATAP